LSIALFVTLLSALTDARTGHIPNAITFGTFVLAFVVNGVMAYRALGASGIPVALASSFGGAIVSGLVPLFLYRAGAIGGGDVKLFIALGALCHPLVGLEIELSGFAVAALVAPFRLAYAGKLGATLKTSLALLVNPLLPEAKRIRTDVAQMTWFRLGPAIFAGTVWVAYARMGAS